MCNCCKNKKEICLLKLKFINYVNDNMSKETKRALELLSTINCENLELVKKELQKIVGDEEKEEEKIIQIAAYGIASISTISVCDSEFNNCKTNCDNVLDKKTCIVKCDDAYYECKNPTTNDDEPSTRVCNKKKYDKCLNNCNNDYTGTKLKNCMYGCNYSYNKCD